jgi:pyruvate dehydrogenase E1 component
MSQKLLVPDIGDFEKVEVIELLIKVGDKIEINDPIITIESDKSSVEIPSVSKGIVELINVKVGDKVSEGDLILSISSSKEIPVEKIIPKDTENIIKEAETILKNQKERTIKTRPTIDE